MFSLTLNINRKGSKFSPLLLEAVFESLAKRKLATQNMKKHEITLYQQDNYHHRDCKPEPCEPKMEVSYDVFIGDQRSK